MLVIVALTFVSAVLAYTNVGSHGFMYKNIDPIKFPGSYSKSHLHQFFGSDAIEATTTTSEELRRGCTSLNNPNDLSTYWTPTLLYTGGASPTPINPAFAAYYENIEQAEIAIPENFRAVSGNSEATSQSDIPSGAGISWFCEGDPGEDKDSAAFPSKTCSTHLQHLIYFPDCVNPTTLNYTHSGTQNWDGDFKPANRCPAGMKRIPRIRFSIRYDLRKVIPDGWDGPAPLALSSGNSYSAHGDAFNGWEKESLQDMLNAKGREFLGISGPDGGPYSGANCQTKDAQPNRGTSDYLTSRKLMGLAKRSMRIAREGF